MEAEGRSCQPEVFGTNTDVISACAAHAAPISDLWMPDRLVPVSAAGGGAPAAASVGYDDHKPRTPPPDLPSLLLDSRITYLGMPVGAHTPLLHL